MDNDRMPARPRFLFIAPLLLVLAFAGHLFNILVLEPALGFSSADDFYDVDKFLPVIGHPVWQMGAFYHFCAGVAILVLARGLAPGRNAALGPYVSVLGIAAALMFVIVSLTNLVGLRELEIVSGLNADDSQAIYGAFLIFRAIVLNGAILFLGIFLILGNAARLALASGTSGARYVGLATGIACVLVPVIPAAVPAMILLIIGWGMLAGILAIKRHGS